MHRSAADSARSAATNATCRTPSTHASRQRAAGGLRRVVRRVRMGECCPRPTFQSPVRSASAQLPPAILVRARASRGLSERAAVLTLVVLAVVAGADRLPPPGVLAVPLDRLVEALGEVHLRLPAERLQLLRGERVAAIVAGPVGHVLD